MAADTELVERVRDELAHLEDVQEKNMMGGRVFMVGGHMACAVHDDTLLVRIDRDDYERLIEQDNVEPMSMTGRTIRTYVQVANAGLNGPGLVLWVSHGLETVSAMPPKTTSKGGG